MSCDVCNATHRIYLKKGVGEPNGHSKLQVCGLDKYTESAYACGNEVKVEGLYVQWKLSCGDTVDMHYYIFSIEKKGGIILSKGVCSVCYFDKNIVYKVELLTRLEVVGKNMLHL